MYGTACAGARRLPVSVGMAELQQLCMWLGQGEEGGREGAAISLEGRALGGCGDVSACLSGSSVQLARSPASAAFGEGVPVATFCD